MNKLANFNGVKALNKKEQKKVVGGGNCPPLCPDSYCPDTTCPSKPNKPIGGDI